MFFQFCKYEESSIIAEELCKLVNRFCNVLSLSLSNGGPAQFSISLGNGDHSRLAGKLYTGLSVNYTVAYCVEVKNTVFTQAGCFPLNAFSNSQKQTFGQRATYVRI